MRYLYGDSVPFPPQYDFLAAFEVFVGNAARAAQLDAEMRQIRVATTENAGKRTRSVEELEKFHRAFSRTVQETAARTNLPQVAEYARLVSERATQIVEEAKQAGREANEREQTTSHLEAERRRAEIRTKLEALLVAIRLPVHESHVTMSHQDGKNEFLAVLTNPDKIVTSFALASGQLGDWQRPRKVSDFAQGVELPVGVRRSLFKRTVQHEMVLLDEFYVGGFDMGEDSAEIRLRRRPEQKDSLVFTLRREDDRFFAEVHYPVETEAEALPPVLDSHAATHLERLWQLIQKSCREVLGHKERLVRVTLGGHEIFDHDRVAELLQLLVKMIAPIANEVARRSPNPIELSLKVENESGRREEIYLRKAELASKLSNVPPAARYLFDPLDLYPPGDKPRPEAESLSEDSVHISED